MILIVFLLIIGSTSSFAEEKLLRVRRVVGGEPTDISHVPYLVNIRKNGRMHCGGSLITPRCVLSAAHCVKQSNAAKFVIRGGVTYLDDYRNSRRVQRIFKPVNFTTVSMDKDVAIFQLFHELKGINIDYIKLSSIDLELDDVVTVSGWGLTSEQAIDPPNQMRSVDVRILSQDECREQYKGYRNVTDNMFCASIPGIKDSCSADSGGPVTYNGELVGIVSWARRRQCGRVESPGVYVKVKAMKTWIENIVMDHCL